MNPLTEMAKMQNFKFFGHCSKILESNTQSDLGSCEKFFQRRNHGSLRFSRSLSNSDIIDFFDRKSMREKDCEGKEKGKKG